MIVKKQLKPKICFDCKWCKERHSNLKPSCENPKSINLVTGEKRELNCDFERTWGECGPVGNWFEPKKYSDR